jgi:endonuclease/exonuclease/phosphatase (EEP) superfamily protein YafD
VDLVGARRYWLIWAAVIPIALWAVVRLFGLERGFPLVPLIAYTPYVSVAALMVAGVAIALRNWAAAGLAALGAFCLLSAVLPRAFGDRAEVRRGDAVFTVLSANIHHGTADPAALVALVDRFHPDLLSVQELTPRFARQLRAVGIDRLLPETALAVRRGVSGSGLYARRPLTRIPEPTRFLFRMPRARIALPGGRSLRVVGVHPYPPLRSRVDEWESALESLPTAGSGVPWVLAGDFNATLDFAELRGILDRGYRDAADATGEGLEPTWPAEEYRSPPVTIDHVLSDERLGIVDYAVEDLPGSDHRAVYTKLLLPR